MRLIFTNTSSPDLRIPNDSDTSEIRFVDVFKKV